MQAEYATQSEFLKDCIGRLKERYPKYSFVQIANEINMLDSTLTRIESGETKNPHFANAIKIVSGLCRDGNIRGYLKENYSPLLKIYDETYGASEDSRFMGDGLEQFYRDPSTYQVMLMIATDAGISRSEIQYNFGQSGVSALEKIIKTGLVVEKDERYYIEEKVNLSPETVSTLVSHLVLNNYDPSKMGTKSNANVIICQSVNGDVVKPWINAQIADLRDRYREFIKKPESKGNDVYWFSMSADMLLKDSMSTTAEKVLQ